MCKVALQSRFWAGTQKQVWCTQTWQRILLFSTIPLSWLNNGWGGGGDTPLRGARINQKSSCWKWRLQGRRRGGGGWDTRTFPTGPLVPDCTRLALQLPPSWWWLEKMTFRGRTLEVLFLSPNSTLKPPGIFQPDVSKPVLWYLVWYLPNSHRKEVGVGDRLLPFFHETKTELFHIAFGAV